jgi:murein DD-endopeptidase MepM/ murein hydrolase activator NlpD
MKGIKSIQRILILSVVFILLNTAGVAAQFISDDSVLTFESPNDSIDLSSAYFDYTDSTGIYFFYDVDTVTSSILTLSYDSISKAYGGAWSNEVLFLFDKDFDPSTMEDSIRVVLQDSTHKFVMPVPGTLNSPFGWRKWQYHYGDDLSLKTGDTVRSAFDGVVRIAKWGWGYGNCIIIRHLNGLETLYGHLSATKVVANQEVKAGDLIGLGGCTGRCYGAHLHFEIRYLGVPINPEYMVDIEGKKLKKDTIYLSKKSFQYITDTKKTATVATTTTYTGTGAWYTIKSGDTLSKIARYYGTTVSTICTLNGISATSILRIGQTLKIK